MCLIVFLAPNESHLERRIQLISSITRALFNCTSNVLFIAHDFDSRSWQCVFWWLCCPCERILCSFKSSARISLLNPSKMISLLLPRGKARQLYLSSEQRRQRNTEASQKLIRIFLNYYRPSMMKWPCSM